MWFFNTQNVFESLYIHIWTIKHYKMLVHDIIIKHIIKCYLCNGHHDIMLNIIPQCLSNTTTVVMISHTLFSRSFSIPYIDTSHESMWSRPVMCWCGEEHSTLSPSLKHSLLQSLHTRTARWKQNFSDKYIKYI